MKLGIKDISNIYLGSKEISKVYLGSKEIFSSEIAPNGSPSSLVATVLSDTSIKLDWIEGSTNQDGYKVMYSLLPNSGFVLLDTILGSASSYTATGLSANTNYYFYIIAYKGGKESSPTNIVNDTTFLTQANTLFSKSNTLIQARKILINQCFKSLNDAGFLNRLVALQLYAAHDEDFSLKDWIGIVTPSKISTPAFEVDRGFTSAAGKAINTGFNPVINGGTKYTTTRYSWGIYSRTNSQTANRDAGHVNATTGTTLRLRQTTDTLGYLAYRNNATAASGTTGAQTDSRGLFVVDKSASTRVDAYYNGASVANNAIAGANPIDNEMFVGCYNNNGTPSSATNREYCLYYAGDSFTSIEHGEIFAILETYLNAIGAGFFLT